MIPPGKQPGKDRMEQPTLSAQTTSGDARPLNGSVFARAGALLYALLILYGSLYPFAGWRDNGITAFAYVRAPLPYYWTGFDVITNILAYVPLGILLVFALFPLLRGFWAMLVALSLGGLLSLSVEALQTFLPSRVSSNLDLMTNFSGACIGAVLGVALTRFFLVESRCLLLRQRWFIPHASRGLVVLGLWPLAQIYPQSYLFGHGQLLPMFSGWLSDWLDTPIDLGAWLRPAENLSVEQYWLFETLITACGLVGALLTLLCLLRPKAPKLRLATLLAVLAISAKALASALLFTPTNAFSWLTPAAEGGLVIGVMMLCGLVFAPPLAQRRVAGLALLTCLLAVNIAPANPYFLATMQEWVQGKFLNFNGAAGFLTLVWPFLALWFLYHPVHRQKSR